TVVTGRDVRAVVHGLLVVAAVVVAVAGTADVRAATAETAGRERENENERHATQQRGGAFHRILHWDDYHQASSGPLPPEPRAGRITYATVTAHSQSSCGL